MGFTRDGQLNPSLQQGRDERLKVSSDDRRKSRESIPTPAVVPGANAWEAGKTPQVKVETVEVKGRK
jgi:hypothetical protein